MVIQIKDLITEFKVAYGTGIFESCLEVAGMSFLSTGDGAICDGILRDSYSLRSVSLPDTGGHMDYNNFSNATINFLKENEYKYKTLYDVMVAEYDPIANYDRREEWSDTKTGQDTTIFGEINTEINTAERNQTNNIGGSTDTAAVSSFDRTTFKGAQQNVRDARVDSSKIGSTKDTSKQLAHDNSIEWDNTVKHTGHIVGNIGTLTTQEMIMSSREVAKFSLYKTIVDDWIRRFAIGIWCVDTHYRGW